MTNFETFVETNYPLASNDVAIHARNCYRELIARSGSMVGTDEFPPLIDRYQAALRSLRNSHGSKLNELFDVGFGQDRRKS